MPEVNHVPFQYEPVPGNLFLDFFRGQFYVERLMDVKETLQFLSVSVAECPMPVEGELYFSDEEGAVPEIRDLRLAHSSDRAELGNPYPRTSVKLWPEE